MNRRTLPLLLIGVCALSGSGCASMHHDPAPTATRQPPPVATTISVAPAAGSITLASESGTPIPDLNDQSPLIQWQGLNITPVETTYIGRAHV